MDVLHVLHQVLAADADLLAKWATARVRTPDQRGVLFRHREQKKQRDTRSFWVEKMLGRVAKFIDKMRQFHCQMALLVPDVSLLHYLAFQK